MVTHEQPGKLNFKSGNVIKKFPRQMIQLNDFFSFLIADLHIYDSEFSNCRILMNMFNQSCTNKNLDFMAHYRGGGITCKMGGWGQIRLHSIPSREG